MQYIHNMIQINFADSSRLRLISSSRSGFNTFRMGIFFAYYNIYSRFSSNSEACASELLENCEYVYYLHRIFIFNSLAYSNTP